MYLIEAISNFIKSHYFILKKKQKKRKQSFKGFFKKALILVSRAQFFYVSEIIFSFLVNMSLEKK